MDVARNYRTAAFLPLVLTLAGLAGAKWLPDPSPNHFVELLHAVASIFAFIGVFAMVPYGVFMAIAWSFFRPEGAAAHRRMAIRAPLIIAVCVGLAAAVSVILERQWDAIPMGFALFGGWALGVGYLHAGIVIAAAEGSAAFARWRSLESGVPTPRRS